MDIDDSEQRKLAADLGKAGYEVSRKAQLVVRKSGFDAEAFMKRPGKRGGIPRDTGALANSAGTDFSEGGMTAIVGTTMNYGPYVARGTRYMAANPYDLRALQAVEPGFVKAMEILGGDILD